MNRRHFLKFLPTTLLFPSISVADNRCMVRNVSFDDRKIDDLFTKNLQSLNVNNLYILSRVTNNDSQINVKLKRFEFTLIKTEIILKMERVYYPNQPMLNILGDYYQNTLYFETYEHRDQIYDLLETLYRKEKYGRINRTDFIRN